MARFLRKHDKKAGLPPGELVFTGQRKVENTLLRTVVYGPEKLDDTSSHDFEEIVSQLNRDGVKWLNIDGVHDSALIKRVGEMFDFSRLALEDVQDTGQRPAIVDFQDYLFITMKILNDNNESGRVKTEQICFILGDKYLITFQEQPGIIFDPVRSRLSRKSGRIRQRGADYLLYTLIDCILENYLEIIERIGERIEDMEEEVIENPSAELLEEINFYRRETAYVRKAVRPVRDVINRLNKSESDLIEEGTAAYLKELSGLFEQIADSIEIYKEMVGDLYNTYNMAIGTRLNETMKFLTVFATIFIPLTFLAGIYGMNFEFIPELKYKYGYFILLGVMLLVGVCMLGYFRKKKWI